MQFSMIWQIARGKTRSYEAKIFLKNVEVDNIYIRSLQGYQFETERQKLVQVMTLKTPKA
jgi:hypothetical protein